MIRIENVITPSPDVWRAAILAARNPMNSWSRYDSEIRYENIRDSVGEMEIGSNDLGLLTKLANNGPVHATYRRLLNVYLDITAPLYFWKEMDRYSVGKSQISCSTMHKIHEKEFTLEDFSCEHLIYNEPVPCRDFSAKQSLCVQIEILNMYRELFNEYGDKKYWWQMIQLLPTSYNQKRTVMLNYEVLANIYKSRKNHKLDEWHIFCEWIEKLPYSELITGESENG